ncbi:hypothetical protein BaRGS_00018465 [Batillaria attramentaria]|uniref:Phlebovirus glycoprotein G2 fusion domain-containing protein n=1 Tax=Batillaria attramentaria TaxID=370345 RepID=A0ABD0KSV6_9CAEN
MCHSLQYLGRLTVYSNVFSRREQLVLARRVHNTYTPLPSNTLRAVRIMGNYNIFFLLAVSTFNVISCDEAVCTPGTVTEGESVNVTCHFGEGADLKIITVHKMANENDMSGSLLECYQKSDIHICYPAPDYKCECRFHGTLFIVTMSDNEPAEYNQCDCTFSDKLTLAIPEVTQKHRKKTLRRRRSGLFAVLHSKNLLESILMVAREVWNIGRSKNSSYDLWQDLQSHGMGELVDERRVSDIWGVITDAKRKPVQKDPKFR